MRRLAFLLLFVAAPAWGARIVTSAARGNAVDMGACDASRENYLFTAYDESSKTDCDSTGGGSTKAVCICRSNVWIPYKAEDIGTACASGKVLKSDGVGNLTCGTDLSGGGGGSTTVEDVDSAPTYSPIDTLQVDQADGFVLTNPGGAGTARIDLAAVPDSILADSYSGVGACGAHNWVSTLNDDAAPGCTQPAFSDLSGSATDAQIPNSITIDLATLATTATTANAGDSATAFFPSGTIEDARIDGSAEADELVLAGDVDGTANANDLDEAAVETELEGVLDLQDLQGAVTDAQVPNTITVDLATLATTATTANAGDSATAFFPSGTLEDARVDGSLEADEVNPTLGSQTQGNYVASVATTAPITGGAAGSEGATLTIALSQNAGTDVTADLEEETHASEHSLGGTDPITATNLASGCTDVQVLGGTSGGTGVECQADDDTPEVGDFGALALTGDVTSSGAATTIAANAVTDSKASDDLTIASTHDIATSGKVQIGSLTAGSAACIARDSATDRLYHDSNCNGTQDTGESFIDGRTAEVSATFTSSDSYQTVTVTGQTWVTANSTIACMPFGTTADGETIDEYSVGEFSAVASTVVAGTGFTVSAFSPNGVTGTYRFECFDTNGGGSGGSAVFSGARVRKSADQTGITSQVALTYDTEDFDTGNFHSNVTNNTRLTIPSAGYYEATCNTKFGDATNSWRRSNILLNGTTDLASTRLTPNAAAVTWTSITTGPYLFAANDYVECTGGASSSGTATADPATNFSIKFVGR